MYTRFLTYLTVFIIIIGGTVGSIMYYMDPLYYYHKLTDKSYFGATERYQMPGLIKGLDYNTLFVGTSMGRNFVEQEADKQFNTKSFNGSLPASTAKEQRMTAQLASKHQDLKHIIWEINYYSFSGKPDWVIEGASPFPTYMYDQNPINDLKYLLSPYSRKMAKANWNANETSITALRDPYHLYKFGDTENQFTIEMASDLIKNIVPNKMSEESKAKVMLKSFDENVVDFIKSNPNINFTLFYAPYAITSPVQQYKTDPENLQEQLTFKREVFKRIKNLSNVKIYDFQDNSDITYNVANYMWDTIHYYKFVNNWILKEMATKPPVTSEKEYDLRLDDFGKMVQTFSLNELRNQPNSLPLP